MVMIRRGRWKFIHTPSDPDQLFDLEADPLELANLAADDAEHEAVVRDFRDEVAERWDLEAHRARRAREPACATRRLRALQQGTTYPWDFQPSRIAAEQYTRNTMDVALRDQQLAFPPTESVKAASAVVRVRLSDEDLTLDPPRPLGLGSMSPPARSFSQRALPRRGTPSPIASIASFVTDAASGGRLASFWASSWRARAPVPPG